MVFSHYQKSILENNLTIITEQIPSVRSISLGVWIKTGTRFESRRNNGTAHFLEHMMFKGTKTKTPRQIARSIESVGGQLNAFTSKELTCYYVEILDEHLRKAVNLLADILCHSTFPEREMEKERQVILDEIQSVEDTPDDLVQELFVEKLFKGNSLGYSILGTKKSVSSLTRDELVHFYENYYHPGNTVIAAAGNVDHSRLISMCRKAFDLPNGNGRFNPNHPRTFGEGRQVFRKPINQAHVCLGLPAFAYAHSKKYDLLVLNALFGGGMSSRLFQNIREKYGLAYSIYSFLDFFSDTGIFGIYFGTDKKNIAKTLKLINREINHLKSRQISDRELREAKAQLKGSLILNMENTANRMVRLAKMEIYQGCFKEIDEIIEDINGVTKETLREAVQELFAGRDMLQVVFEPLERK